jgi:hypothetical protein
MADIPFTARLTHRAIHGEHKDIATVQSYV